MYHKQLGFPAGQSVKRSYLASRSIPSCTNRRLKRRVWYVTSHNLTKATKLRLESEVRTSLVGKSSDCPSLAQFTTMPTYIYWMTHSPHWMAPWGKASSTKTFEV